MKNTSWLAKARIERRKERHPLVWRFLNVLNQCSRKQSFEEES